ncbi:Claudin-10 [Liparis tanakae]|uniref:Claudin n=1 Tax=Liparis tanakae TaxID=230148 RepID=A0A4Z2H8D1_9TELE|nr:Claudin-10 [Liparis tanakae]
MATEIVAFVLTISGWILVSSTLPIDYWKVSSVDGTVITTATFWSNLWKTCVTDSTGVSNCKDFPSMLALDATIVKAQDQERHVSADVASSCVRMKQSENVMQSLKHAPLFSVSREVYIQVCRGLMIAAVCLGFFGATLALVGMKCTRIGGSETTKARLTVLSGSHFVLSGLCCMTACSIYAHRVTTDFFDPLFVAQKAEYSYPGAAAFVSGRNKTRKTVSGLQREEGEPPRQFGRNAYV